MWVVCSSLHLFSKSFPNKIKMHLQVSERGRKAGGLAVQDRGLVWRQQVGSGMAAITCLALAAPGSPPGSTRATLKAAVPTRVLAAVLSSGKVTPGSKIHAFIYLCIF